MQDTLSPSSAKTIRNVQRDFPEWHLGRPHDLLWALDVDLEPVRQRVAAAQRHLSTRLLAGYGLSVLLVDRKASLEQAVHTTGIFVRRSLEDFSLPAAYLGPPSAMSRFTRRRVASRSCPAPAMSIGLARWERSINAGCAIALPPAPIGYRPPATCIASQLVPSHWSN